MRKRYMTLHCTQAETEYRLKQQLRVYPPKGMVEENNFKIYKHLPGLFVASGVNSSLFCFCGEYRQVGNCTYMAYRIRPGFSIFLFYLLLSLSTLFLFYQVIFMDEPMITTVIPLGFLLLCTLITQLEKKKCITDFEKRLTAKIHYKK